MEEMDNISPAFSPLKSILDSGDEESTSLRKSQFKVKINALAFKKDQKRLSHSLKTEDNKDNEGVKEPEVGGKTGGRKSSLLIKNSRASDIASPKSEKRLSIPLQALETLKVENDNNESNKKSIKKESTRCDTDEDEADNKEQLNDSVQNELPSKKRSHRVLSSSSEENTPLMCPKDWDSDNVDDHGIPLKYEIKKKISPIPKQVTKVAKVHTARASSSGSDSDDSSDLDLDDDDEEENRKRKSRDKKKTPRAPAKKRTKPEYRSPIRRLGESDEENNSEEEGGLELIRKQTEERMNALINSLRNPELEKQFSILKPKNTKAKSSTSRQKRKGGNGDDSTFKFSGMIPIEQRKSSRLRNKRPEYTSDVIDELHETMRRTYFKRPNYRLEDHLIEDLEEVVYRPKRKSHGKRKVEERIIIPVEAVTQEMLDNIALRVKGKVYSADGTTCHQCRQKTLDQKTCCRSPNCSGILGMFCGVCIKNRYGEDAAEALLNPNWICPVCRGKCNCSICRTKQGKRPTGILAPLAQQSGYESVDHFLDTLRGEGDKPEDDSKWKLKRDPEALLGFSHNGNWAHFNNGSFESVSCNSCAYNEWDNPDNLLGFSKDGNTACMGGKKEETLCKPKNQFLSALQLKSK